MAKEHLRFRRIGGLGCAVLFATVAGVSGATDKSAGFVKAADYSASHGGRAILIQQGDKLLFERYDNGWSASTPHPLASGTKSFTGVLAIMAVQDGLLSLDEKAADTLNEWKGDLGKSKITVRQLLTLSSGLAPGDAQFGGRSGSNLLGFAAAQRANRLGLNENAGRPTNNFLTALSLPMNFGPGTRFQYGPGNFYAFGELLQRKLEQGGAAEKTVLDYMTKRLLQPIGIEVARIGRDRAGNPNLPGGMLLTAREWAKFGEFVLNKGSVMQKDRTRKELLKPELLAQCFEPSQANAAYGLTWWLRSTEETDVSAADFGGLGGQRPAARGNPSSTSSNKGAKIYMAAGLGKQRLYVIPEFNLVVVRFAEGTREGLRFQDKEFLELILGSSK